MNRGNISSNSQDYESIKISLLRNNVILHPSLIVRKSAIDLIGGYNEKYYYSADYDLVCNIAFNGKIVNIPDILMRYRFHGSQISSRQHVKQKKYADLVRLAYIKKPGFTFFNEEEELFNKAMNNEYLSQEEKESLKDLSMKFILQNRKNLFFEKDKLKSFLEYYIDKYNVDN